MKSVFLVFVVLGVLKSILNAETPRFGRADGGFGGLYRLDHRTEAALLPGKTEGRFTGYFEHDERWDVNLSEGGRGLTGTAVRNGRSLPVEFWFEDDELNVKLGRDSFSLHRVVPLDQRLAYLETPADAGPTIWTLAAYIGGDNDLEESALADLAEMRSGLPTSGVEVLALIDRHKEYDTGEGDWTGTRLYRIRRDAEPQLLLDLGEMSTASPVTLASFLIGAFNAYPSKHVAAVIWDHGGGWTGIVHDDDLGDAPGGGMLSMMDVRAALRTALLSTQRQKLDLLIFDACIMAQLEVALQVNDLAHYMVASEANVPGDGMPYHTVLPLFAGDSLDTRSIAINICDKFQEYYTSIDNERTTISAIDLSKVEAITKPLDDLASLGALLSDSLWPQILRSAFYAENYGQRAARLEPNALPSVDIIDFVRRIEEGAGTVPVDPITTAVREAVSNAVIHCRNGDHRRTSNGLAVFMPRISEQNKPGYAARSPLGRNNRWLDLFTRAHEQAARGKDEPVTFADVVIRANVVDGRAHVRPFDGDSVEFTVTGNSIIELTRADLLAQEDGSFVVLRREWVPDSAWMARVRANNTDLPDLFMPKFVDGENHLAIELTGQRFQFSNGTQIVNLTLNRLDPTPGQAWLSLARLHPADGTPAYEVVVAFDPVHWVALFVVQATPPPGVEPRTFRPAPEDEIEFLLETFGTDGAQGELATERIPWGKNPVLFFTADDPGDYLTAIVARTMDGRLFETNASYSIEENPALAEWVASWETFDPAALDGNWRRSVLLPDHPPIDTGALSSIGEAVGGIPTLRSVETEVTLDGAKESFQEFWLFRADPVPTLRVIQRVKDAPDLCWYGPVTFGEIEGRRFIAMKNLPMGGVLWRWERGISLRDLLINE